MIKYADKLEYVDNHIFISNEYRVVANSLQEIVELIKNKNKYRFFKNKRIHPYIMIKAKPLNPSNMIFKEGGIKPSYSLLEAKSLLSKHCIDRWIYLSLDLDEIYFESIDIRIIGEGDTSITNFFDYAILYGNKEYNFGDIVSIPKWRSRGRTSNIYKITEVPYPKNSIITDQIILHFGIFCIYEGQLLDNNNQTIGYVEELDPPIPVALFNNKK